MKYAISFLLAWGALGQTREHAEASMVLRLQAPPEVVFPLFGPIREAEWAPHWNPTLLFPADRAQKAGAVFTTRQHDRDVIWILTTYDAAAFRIGYVMVAPGQTAGQLDITLKAIGEKETEATVTHRWTSLAGGWDSRVKEFGEQFPFEREHWEHAIGARLRELTAH